MHIVVGGTALHPGKDFAVSLCMLPCGIIQLPERSWMLSAFARSVTARTSEITFDGRYPLPFSLVFTRGVFGLSSPNPQRNSERSPDMGLMTITLFRKFTRHQHRKTPKANAWGFCGKALFLFLLWLLFFFMCVSSFCHGFYIKMII